jgi:hypothetical protein
LPPEKVPAFAVPRMGTPLKIDGPIDPTEWREAAALSGVGNWTDDVLLPRPTTFCLGWDEVHLYFASRSARLAARSRGGTDRPCTTPQLPERLVGSPGEGFGT